MAPTRKFSFKAMLRNIWTVQKVDFPAISLHCKLSLPFSIEYQGSVREVATSVHQTNMSDDVYNL